MVGLKMNKEKIHREGFIHGIAYDISWLYQNYQYDYAENFLISSGLSIADFKQANVPESDLKTIKELLK